MASIESVTDRGNASIGAYDRPPELNNGIYTQLKVRDFRWWDAEVNKSKGGDTLFLTVQVLDSRSIPEGEPEFHPANPPDESPYTFKIPGFNDRDSNKRAVGQAISVLARIMGKSPHDKRDWMSDLKNFVKLSEAGDPRIEKLNPFGVKIVVKPPTVAGRKSWRLVTFL